MSAAVRGLFVVSMVALIAACVGVSAPSQATLPPDLTPPATSEVDAATARAVPGQGPVTLRLALSDPPGHPSEVPLHAFVQAVHNLSEGAVTIEPTYEAGGDAGERGTVQLLADDRYDLAFAPTRALEVAGVTKPEALLAPFLIDNDALAIAAAKSPIAEDLLAGMSDQGFTGLTMWPEDLRHPAAYDQCGGPILAPSDLHGMSVRVIDETVADDLYTLLGATPSNGDLAACGTFQGGELGLQQVLSVPGPTTLTADVTFFPKYFVLAANAAAFQRLPDRWQPVLRDAAVAAQAAAMHADPTDVGAAIAWCDAGNGVVLAGPDAVAAFKAAAQPELDKLVADPALGPTIQAIRALKASIKPSPNATACRGPVTAPSSNAPAAGPT